MLYIIPLECCSYYYCCCYCYCCCSKASLTIHCQATYAPAAELFHCASSSSLPPLLSLSLSLFLSLLSLPFLLHSSTLSLYLAFVTTVSCSATSTWIRIRLCSFGSSYVNSLTGILLLTVSLVLSCSLLAYCQHSRLAVPASPFQNDDHGMFIPFFVGRGCVTRWL